MSEFREHQETRSSISWAIIILMIFIAMVAILEDNEEDRRAEREYCEMVALHDRTDGAYGWPPFRDDLICEGY